MKKTITTLLLATGLIGCSTPRDGAVTIDQNIEASLSESSICCVSYKEFVWTQLDKSESIKFKVDSSSPIWDFPEGKSHFASFAFSEQSRLVELVLSSHMLDKRVFAPKVVTLDSDFNVVDEYKLDEFYTYYSDALSPNRYEKKLSIDATKTPYIVVYTDKNQIGNTIQIPHPAKVRAMNSGDPLPLVTDLTFTHSYTGEFELKLDTLSLNNISARKAVEKRAVQVQPESKMYYTNAIKQAVKENNIPKALSLLDEAKALNIEGAQEVFIKALNER